MRDMLGLSEAKTGMLCQWSSQPVSHFKVNMESECAWPHREEVCRRR